MVYTDIKFDQKVAYLRKLLGFYVRFLKYYNSATVVVDKDVIRVIYDEAQNNGYQFQSIEFPRKDLNKRILHYKNKLRTMIKNRHSNPNWR